METERRPNGWDNRAPNKIRVRSDYQRDHQTFFLGLKNVMSWPVQILTTICLTPCLDVAEDNMLSVWLLDNTRRVLFVKKATGELSFFARHGRRCISSPFSEVSASCLPAVRIWGPFFSSDSVECSIPSTVSPSDHPSPSSFRRSQPLRSRDFDRAPRKPAHTKERETGRYKKFRILLVTIETETSAVLVCVQWNPTRFVNTPPPSIDPRFSLIAPILFICATVVKRKVSCWTSQARNHDRQC